MEKNKIKKSETQNKEEQRMNGSMKERNTESKNKTDAMNFKTVISTPVPCNLIRKQSRTISGQSTFPLITLLFSIPGEG
jgi:hypothetical protein